MRARGREIIIITAVIIVVVCVAWWFLFFNPLRKDVSSLNDQIAKAQTRLEQTRGDLRRLQGFQKTSPQTQADLLRYNKMLPSQTGVPGVMIEIEQTALDSSLDFAGIQPGAVAAGQPFSVQPITLTFTGGFFALEDFLSRLENYVEYRNMQFLVTGRLLEVAQMTLTPLTQDNTTSGDLTISLTINAYLWSGVSPAGASVGTPQPTAMPTPSASSSGVPSAVPSASPSGLPTATPSGSGSPAGSPLSSPVSSSPVVSSSPGATP